MKRQLRILPASLTTFGKSPPASARSSLEPKQTCRSVGFVETPNLSHNKKHSNKSHCVFYGATYGTELEKNCIEFAQLSVHETELIANIKMFMYVQR